MLRKEPKVSSIWVFKIYPIQLLHFFWAHYHTKPSVLHFDVPTNASLQSIFATIGTFLIRVFSRDSHILLRSVQGQRSQTVAVTAIPLTGNDGMDRCILIRDCYCYCYCYVAKILARVTLHSVVRSRIMWIWNRICFIGLFQFRPHTDCI